MDDDASIENKEKSLPEMSPQEIAKALTDAPKEFVEQALPVLQEFIGLLQLATAGDATKIDDLMNKPGNFMHKLLQADQSMLMGFIEAKGLWYILQPVDPDDKITHRVKLDWAKLITDIAKHSEIKRITEKGSFGPVAGPTSGEAAKYSNELIREVVGDSEDPGPEGTGQGSN